MHFLPFLTLGLISCSGTSWALPHGMEARTVPSVSPYPVISAVPTATATATATAAVTATPTPSPGASNYPKFPTPKVVSVAGAPPNVQAVQRMYFKDWHRYKEAWGARKARLANKLRLDLKSLSAAEKTSGISDTTGGYKK